MPLLSQDELLVQLEQAVHHPGPGVGKITADGLKAFLTILVTEMLARSAAGGPGAGTDCGWGTGTGAPAGVLVSPHLLAYRLAVTDAGELRTVPAEGQPLPASLDVLTAPNGLVYRLTVADDGTLRTVPASGTVDPAAAAFIAAAGLVNVGHQVAVNDLVRTLKVGNLWPRLRALYPMVGGTAKAHALNLKDPRDADEAFRLTFPYGAQHTALGAGWDGATQYADTHFVPTQLTLNSCHLGYYATTTTPDRPSHVEIGVVEAGRSLSLVCNFNGGYFQAEFPSGAVASNHSTALGFSLGNQLDGHAIGSYRDGQSVGYAVGSPNVAYPNDHLLLAHRQDGFYSDRTCGLASIGDGFTPDEAVRYSAAVRTFQQALGRAVA
jgi:hypothetical protein